MHDLQTASYYAKRVTPHLPKEAFKAAPIRLLGGLAYLLFLVGSTVVIATSHLPWFVLLPLSFAMGQAMAGMGFLGHEVLHGQVVRNARLREFLGTILFAQFSLGPTLWRKWHNMTHHANTQHPDDDPDAMGTMEAFFSRPGLQFFYRFPQWVRSLITFGSFLGFFSVFAILKFREFYPEATPLEKRTMVRQLVLPYLFWFALLLVIGPVNWFWAYLLPLAVANFTVISYISTNHHLNPLTETNDPLANSLSVTVPRWVDVLHFNFSYHVEHHLYPGMSPKWAPLVKAELKRQFPEKYHEMSLFKALVLLWKTPRIYKDHVELVDPHRGIAYPTLGHGLDPQASTPASSRFELHPPEAPSVRAPKAAGRQAGA
jgi:fatty acid desaturase